jgi:hypothetical protein
MAAMAAVLATTVLSRFPDGRLTAVTNGLAHSFSYNRLGFGFCLIPLLAVLMPCCTRRQVRRYRGVIKYSRKRTALMCNTFIAVVLPPDSYSSALQRRWPPLVTTLIDRNSQLSVFDPTGQQFFSERFSEYALECCWRIGDLPFKTQRILLNHIIVIIALIGALV